MDLDWRVQKTLLQRLKYMLDNNILCDVTFKVGRDQEKIEACKFILRMQSPVFEKMFDGSFCESEKDPVIPDLCPAAFRALLRYCYYECLDIHSDIALSVLYAAKKYMLPLLEVAAQESVVKNLDKSDMLEIAKYAADTGDNALHEACRNYIVLNVDELNVWDIQKLAADTGDDVLQEITRNYLVRNLDGSNVWGMFEYATITGDDKLYAACRNYIVLTLNLSNIWEVCKYATDTGHEELHASCKKYLIRNLNELNVWEVCKYATDTGDEELHAICKKYLIRHLNELNVWEVCKYVTDTGDDEMHASCKKYFQRILKVSNIWEIYTYSIFLQDEELNAKCMRFLANTLNLIWKVCKYAMDLGDEALEENCKKYLDKNVFVRDLWKICKYATDKENEEICAHCSTYLEKNKPDVTKPAFVVGDNNFHSCCDAYLNGQPVNIWELYKYAMNVGDQEVKSLCRQYFKGDIRAVREALQTGAFLNLPYEVLLDFLHINDKAVHVDEYTELKQGTQTDIRHYQNCIGISISEIELFKACNASAQTECRRQKIESTSANKRTVLGECLHLIRFPTMLQKDLLSVVYPTGLHTQVDMAERVDALSGLPVKGQPNVKLSKEANKKESIEQGFYHQLDSASRERQFLVKPSGDYRPGAIGTVFIESEVRVMLSRIWTSCPGRYKVTVSDKSSETSWSVVLNTKHQFYLSGENGLKQDDILPYLDVTPQVVLALGTKYSVTTERTECTDFMYRQPGVQYTRIRFDELKVGFSEITVTRDVSTESNVYALTLCLI